MLLLVTVVLLFASPAIAGQDGAQLLDDCNQLIHAADGVKPEEPTKAGIQIVKCMSYVWGVMDTLNFQKIVCTEGVLPIDAIRIVVNYLKAHPERLDATAVESVVRAFNPSVFRCLP